MNKWQKTLLNSAYGIIHTDTDSIKVNCKYYKQGLCYAQKGAPAVACYGDTFECELETEQTYQNNPFYIFKHKLNYELKKRIKDYAKIYFIDNVLLIEFYHVGSLSITYIETGIAEKIERGLTTAELADKIDKWYKSIILSRYFVTQK